MVSEIETKRLFSDVLIRKIFNSLTAHIAIIDGNGWFLETNEAWNKYSITNGLTAATDFRKMNYLNICEIADGAEISDAQNVAQGIRDVIEGEVKEFLYDYPCHSPDRKRWFYMRAVLMSEEDPVRVIVSHEDITELKLTQEALKENQETLEDRNQSLEEANIALKVLIKHRETDKSDLEKKFITNIKTFVSPYLDKLKDSRLSEKDKTLVRIVDDHLKDMMSPMMNTLSNASIMLTPQEIHVASLVKDGKTTAEISDILFVSEATISFHRKNLRKKLGLNKSRKNLRSYLLSMN